MKLEFVSRQAYRQKNEPAEINRLMTRYPNAYIIPEGGSNTLAVAGFESVTCDLEQQCPDWTHLYTAVGTGGTLAGLVKHASYQKNRSILGVAVLKQAEQLLPQITEWIGLGQKNKWQLLTEFHQGGYAKMPPHFLEFMHQFEAEFKILLDPIYTAKMAFSFFKQLDAGHIPPGSTVILLHTGGLQGRQI